MSRTGPDLFDTVSSIGRLSEQLLAHAGWPAAEPFAVVAP
jgi:hypothetical protein